MRAAPDDPDGYTEFTRLALRGGLYTGRPAEEAARYLDLGLPEEADAVYAELAAALGPDRSYAELAEQRARVATALGDAAAAERHRAEAAHVLAQRRMTSAVFDGVAELTGCDLVAARGRPSEPIEVILQWRLLEQASAPLVAYVHFRGQFTRFGDDRPLPRPIKGLGNSPQHVLERRRVFIPADAQPGGYRVVAGLWEPESRRPVRLWWRGLLPTTNRTVRLGVIVVMAER
jgi:hypothetical protein